MSSHVCDVRAQVSQRAVPLLVCGSQPMRAHWQMIPAAKAALLVSPAALATKKLAREGKQPLGRVRHHMWLTFRSPLPAHSRISWQGDSTIVDALQRLAAGATEDSDLNRAVVSLLKLVQGEWFVSIALVPVSARSHARATGSGWRLSCAAPTISSNVVSCRASRCRRLQAGK